MAVLHLRRLVRMSGGVLVGNGQIEMVIHKTYGRLLLGILTPSGLCAEICPHAAIATAVDAATGGSLCVEYGQFGDPSLDAGDWRLVLASGVSPHQALSIVAIVIVVVV